MKRRMKRSDWKMERQRWKERKEREAKIDSLGEG